MASARSLGLESIVVYKLLDFARVCGVEMVDHGRVEDA